MIGPVKASTCQYIDCTTKSPLIHYHWRIELAECMARTAVNSLHRIRSRSASHRCHSIDLCRFERGHMKLAAILRGACLLCLSQVTAKLLENGKNIVSTRATGKIN